MGNKVIAKDSTVATLSCEILMSDNSVRMCSLVYIQLMKCFAQ